MKYLNKTFSVPVNKCWKRFTCKNKDKKCNECKKYSYYEKIDKRDNV